MKAQNQMPVKRNFRDETIKSIKQFKQSFEVHRKKIAELNFKQQQHEGDFKECFNAIGKLEGQMKAAYFWLTIFIGINVFLLVFLFFK